MRNGVSSHLCFAATVIFLGCVPARTDWPQWGGPNRNFTVEASGLADKWPEDGPPKLWYRELGDGYSSIVVSDGMLYTMYRKTRTDEEESIVALDASNGKIVWEHKYRSPLTKPVEEWGHGPNATPLIVDRHLFTVGTNAVVNCLDKNTGKVLWTRDLVDDREAPPVHGVGYTCSPIAYKRAILVPVGTGRPNEQETPPPSDGQEAAPAPGETGKPLGKGQSLLALDQATGRTIWKGLDFETGVSSPLLINFAGQEQVVLYTSEGVVGADPRNGELLWRHDVPARSVIMSPVWNGEDLLFWSTGSDGGAGLVIKLKNEDRKTVPKEYWTSRRMRVEIATPIRVGDHAFGSSGRLYMGMNLNTGKRTWAVRGYKSASCVYGDGKVIILDENGKLTLATATPEAFTVYSQCQITERYSYTPPTLVDTTLYVRDRKHIMALDVGESPHAGLN
jgi:outer membrane protein assembly factor BamB